ncbi:transaldolase [Dyadobacter fanqingshengii]|uniref:Transaldolase n=1 Tax=Dyadobacter fanqingshengii TaxID=2906443 RepID=A0A9X1PBA6_9BACT|nr:transaldolase [Dyadobacter fanqingshengii]MCF0042009.1 transaldolase [Dyadobacter fanqingshengii]USJ36288.1 transaldolase [Dyadobacter fanqingshengii]
MDTNKVKRIHDFGQSIWLDFIDRKVIFSGELKKLIEEDGVRGITSNPAIFEKAISSSSDYDADIAELSKSDKTNEEIFFGLAVTDIKLACDIFWPVYNEKDVVGADGYVSLEVSPFLAMDTQATIIQARQLWEEVGKANVMIKIPGTESGLIAIETAISEGININVTLLFSLERYEAVTEAYISGLEKRAAQGLPVAHVSSVASFFLSRIDILVDPFLDRNGIGELKGEIAIASAKLAYQIYKRVFSTDRWKRLAEKGAVPQRLLWASTSNKNPEFKDTRYVEALIGPDTVNTVPLETLEAYRDHGDPASRLESDLEAAKSVMERVKAAGIDMGAVTKQLEDEGIEKFNAPFQKLLDAIEKQK